MTVTSQEAMDRLDGISREMGALSGALHKVSQLLEEADKPYSEFVDVFEVGLWLKCQEDDGPRWPSEAMRVKLARREMPAELLGRRDGLVRKRDRIKQRIADLKAMADADRSILSALKVEIEATR